VLRPVGLAVALRALVLGAAIAALAQLALPLGAALYDGVIPTEPYRFLAPGSGQVGSPTSYSADLPVTNGTSPQITAATNESPPQAQLIALAAAFTVPAGTATVHVSITAVPPVAAVPHGTISGNVYRVAVTDPSGTALAIAGSQRPTLAMRSAGSLTDAAIVRFSGGSWQQLDTVSNASLAVYTAQPDALGDFAIVDLAGGGIATTDLVIAGTIVIVLAAIAIWAFRTWRRRRAIAAEEAEQARPPRRKAPGRRPPPPASRRRR